mmetsp:Transcript_74540/g.129261  ORF Transcript_74540/g.129261 Transcript_74540/m.129261 type:complete len:1481 (+) Transcript_74540:72-4514(+)
MSSRAGMKQALAQMREARSGDVTRVEQYTVEEKQSVFKTVSETEWRTIVEQRRDDFVVSDRQQHGYVDNGKEIWEDNRQERMRVEEEMRRQAAAKAKDKAAAAAPGQDSPSSERPREALLTAFNAGARRASASESVASTQPTRTVQKDLDDVLQQMMGALDSEDPAAPPAVETSSKPARAKKGATKRKGEASEVGGSKGKKVSKVKEEVTVKSEQTQEDAPTVPFEPVKIKKERVDDTQKAAADAQRNVANAPVTVKYDGPTIKDELQEPPIKSEPQEPPIKSEPMDDINQEQTPNAPKTAQSKESSMDAWLSDQAYEGPEADPKQSAGQLKPALEEDGALWFFFIDAFEEDRATPPKVYLFGKVLVGQAYQSCCLVVERLERCVHLLLNVSDPDDEAAAEEAAKAAEIEFDQLCRTACPSVKKLRAKLKYRNYAFEKSLPQEAGHLPFLKVVCDAAGPAPPQNMVGETFSHVFGSDTRLLERLMLTRRINGPSWIRLIPGSFHDSSARLSFCAIEFRITPASITTPKTDEQRRQLSDMGCPTASPPLRVLSLSMQTMQRSAQHGHEPVAFACTLHPNVSPDASDNERHLRVGMTSWMAVRRFDTRPLPRDAEKVLPKKNVAHFSHEGGLFKALLDKIQEFDPDVIACHNAYAFELDVLASRMAAQKLQNWQRLGRLRRARDQMPRLGGRQAGGFWVGSSVTAGRLVCDLGLQAKDLLPKLTSYELSILAQHQINEPAGSLQEIEPEMLPRYFDSAAALVGLSERTLRNALAIARLMHSLQILPLTKQLTNLAGNTWNMSLQNKRAERNEMLLCHEFHRGKFVLPDKESTLTRKRRAQLDAGAGSTGLDDAEGHGEENGAAAVGARRGKAAYSGGLVLDPKVGLYDEFIMMLDFNSLYPSIIQEHNICFTTVERPDEQQVAQLAGEAELLAKTHLPDGTETEGVLPRVLRRLVESRRQVKGMMKSERDPKRLQTLEIRQKALKLTANSMYGCLGFQNSRFHARPLAALITYQGRLALQSTITVVTQELGLEVVYGDTDSVFVNTKMNEYQQAVQVAEQIKRSVNKRYKKLEIEIDGVFHRLLLLKKKKYAGLKVVNWEKKIFEPEIKGLDIVRRDWCPLAKNMGENIVHQVLSNTGKEEAVNWIHNFLTEQCGLMDTLKVPLEKYVITKGLTKAPQDYPDAKNQPHVQVALRLQARGKHIRAGQEVEYIICESAATDGPKESYAARARHPQEFDMDKNLRVDIAWYKSQQVHPLISRLLGPVEGTDASRLAECLGMDGSRFNRAAAIKDGIDDEIANYAGAAAADVDALLNRNSRFKSFSSTLPGAKCQKCNKDVPWKQLLQPQVSDASGVQALFRCGECGEEVKPAQAQNLLVMQIRNLLRNHCEGWVQCVEEAGLVKTKRMKHGNNLTGERQVLQELEFMEHMCDAARNGYAGHDSRGCRGAADGMLRHVRWLLDVNGQNWVDCGKVFGSIFGGMSGM